MKVEIQYILKAESSTDKDWLGRKAWVVRTEEGLTFGNIYTTVDTASDLDDAELNYLQQVSVNTNKFVITQVLA
jgi:hypothetical protein